MKRLAIIVVALLLLPFPAHASSPEPPFTPPDGWLYLEYERPMAPSGYRFHKWLYATHYVGDLVAESAAALRERDWAGCQLLQLDPALFLARSGTAWQLSYWCQRGADEIAVMWMLADQGESLMLVYSTAVGEATMPPVPTILGTARETSGEMEIAAAAPAEAIEISASTTAGEQPQGSVLGSWTNPLWLLMPGAAGTILFLEFRRRRTASDAETPALGGAPVRIASESAVPPAAP